MCERSRICFRKRDMLLMYVSLEINFKDVYPVFWGKVLEENVKVNLKFEQIKHYKFR